MVRPVYLVIFLWFLLLAGCKSGPQPIIYPDYRSGSGISIGTINETRIDNLEVLGKVWGFVKYHHPVFADSTYRIEPELFPLINATLDEHPYDRNTILYNWIKGFGEFDSDPGYYECITASEDHFPTNDCGWIKDSSVLGEDLSRLLLDLRFAKRKSNIYVRWTRDDFRIPVFHRTIHEDTAIPDTGFRLLALFEYWNMIEYFFPYRDITDKDWNSVLREYIPDFVFLKDESYYQVLSRIVAETNDSHSYHTMYYYHLGRRFIPVSFRFIGEKLIVGDNREYGDVSGNIFLPGDEILEIDGQTPSEILAGFRNTIAHSTEGAFKRDVANLINYVKPDQVKMLLLRNDRKLELVVRTIPLNDRKEVKKENIFKIEGTTGYLLPCVRDERTDMDSLKKEIDCTTHLIIDMREYPSFLSNGNSSFLLDRHTPKSLISEPSIILPGWYELVLHAWGEENPDAYKGKIIVLVDENTQSMGEYITMMLQSRPETIIVGSQTAGADGNAVYLNLPGNTTAVTSGIGIYYPDGTPTQRIGVKIDHYVEPTVKGIKEGRDEIYEYALELIQSEKNSSIK